jgi:DNA-binding response OmpR family regulator
MRRILIVDDEVEVADSIAALLKFRGYEADVAITGTAALKIAQDSDVGMVLLDWNLGTSDPNGVQLVRRLREVCGGIPVVVVSADPQVLAEALRADVSDYLPKPFMVSELLRMVDEYCVWGGN